MNELPEDYLFLGLTKRDVERTRLGLEEFNEKSNAIWDQMGKDVADLLKNDLFKE